MKQSVMGKDLLPGTVHGSQWTVETAGGRFGEQVNVAWPTDPNAPLQGALRKGRLLGGPS